MIPRVLEPQVMDDAAEAREYADADFYEVNLAFVERLIALGAAGRMLDLGTGPADIPLLLAERDPEARILEIDLSEAMLTLARQRITDHHAGDQVTLARGDATALAFEEASFEVVFSNTILHHLPDPIPMLREAVRVLKPGGLLAIRDLYRPDSLESVEHLVRTHTGDQTPAAQQLFRQSLIAAHTPDELQAIIVTLGYAGQIEVVIDTDRHVTIQGRKRE